MISILSRSYDEYFGFTQKEVDRMLQYYNLDTKRDQIKQWYDGYMFGDTEVYNPWSVANYVDALFLPMNCRRHTGPIQAPTALFAVW